jgi:hypothetical protein
MDRFRATASVEGHLRGKEVKVLDSAEDYYLIQLLEDAGEIESGNIFSCNKNNIEHYNEETKTAQYYDPEMVELLEERMNQPYEEVHGTPCSSDDCDNENGFEYELTGHVIDDTQGVYVEKKCKLCGAITLEGDGEFHSYYLVSELGIECIEQ